MDVVARILDVARRNSVNAVLCVGDIFDDPEPAPDFWEGLARTFQGHTGQHPPLFLVPGNHDPLTAESVWAAGHPFRARLPAWVHLSPQASTMSAPAASRWSLCSGAGCAPALMLSRLPSGGGLTCGAVK